MITVSFDQAIGRHASAFLIGKLFLQSAKHRHSGRDCRNLGSMDGQVLSIPAIWFPAIPAGMTELLRYLSGQVRL